jgi:peptide/nickel transport system permease protein
MSKLNFFVRRAVQLVATLWAIATALFMLFRLMPGDPTAYIISPQMSAEVRQQIIDSYGLNDPLWVQYLRYMENLATLNLGRSFHSKQQVTDILANYLPNTLILMLSAFTLAYTLGITIGVLTGWYRGTRFEKSAVVAALVGRSVPSFWVGILALWIFGATFNLIPMSGMTEMGTETTSFWGMVFSVNFLQHLITPMLVLAFYYMGYPLLIMRNSMLETLSEDFIDIARAAVTTGSIAFRAAWRNMIARSESPLARAMSMKSSERVSSMLLRMMSNG